MRAPLPPDEEARLATLIGCAVLDTAPDPQLDELVRTTAAVLDAPIALISLVDRARQWFLARIGLQVRETPRDIAFCAHAILGHDVLVVADTLADERFRDNPLVTAEPRIRFYAGAPLLIADHAIGTLCVIDHEPRTPDGEHIHTLRVLAHQVVTYLELRTTQRERARLERERDLERERARLRDEIQQAQKMESIGRLAGGIAHDFNNVLTVILGYADLALGTLRDEDPARLRVAGILDAAQRAAALTRQLLAFSRKQILHPRPVDVERAVRDLAPMLQRLLGEDIELALDLGPCPQPVMVDAGQLDQVLINLAANARDAMPRGGSLRIAARCTAAPPKGAIPDRAGGPDGGVAIEVTDDGAGMDEAIRARVFEPFFTTKEPGKGTGVGLSQVFGVVAQSGGAVAVASRPGAGTTVTVWLPAASGATPSDERSSDAGPSPVGGSVLLVEDEDIVRELAAEALAAHGLEVDAARDAREALRRAEDRSYDLLITDIVMPGMSGIELARAMRARRPGMRVLYTSGYSEAAISRYGVLTEGALIEKPYTLDALVAQARRELAHRND